MTGIPCRHMCMVLGDVQPSHVHPRWYQKNAAYYKDERFPEVTKQFKEQCRDRRLIIEHFEYETAMRNVRRLEDQTEDLPSDYWSRESIVLNPFEYGIVPAVDTESNVDRFAFGDEALLSTEVCLSQELADDDIAVEQRDTAKTIEACPINQVVQSSNIFQASQCLVRRMAEIAERSNDPRLGSELLSSLRQTYGRMQKLLMESTTPKDFSGTYVSAFIPVDTRRKCIRIQAYSEKKKRRKTKAQQRTAVHLSVGSLVTKSAVSP